MAEMTKITKKRVYNVVRDYIDNSGVEKLTDEFGDISVEDILDVFDKAVEQLDAKNAKAKERAAEKRAEGDEVRQRIFDVLTDEYKTLDDIAADLDDAEITKSKIVARLAQLVKAGQVEKDDVKNGERKVKGYRVAAPTEE